MTFLGKRWQWVACIWLILCSQLSYAEPALQLIQNSQSTLLSEQVRIFEETNSELNIETIRKNKEQFIWPQSSNPNYGLHDGGLWLYVRFTNLTDVQQWVADISFAHLDKVDFYLFREQELLAESKQGKLNPTALHRFPTFNVTLPYATHLDLFVRIESKHNNIIAPLSLQPADVFTRYLFWDNLIWGLFYGGLLILAIYNLVLYLSNHETSLLAYVCYIGAVLIWQFVWGGHLAMLMPGGLTPWLSLHMDLIFVLIGIASGGFTYTFLNAAQTAPKTAPFIKTNILLLLLMGILSVINVLPPLWQNALVYLVSLFAIISYLVAGFESYFNKFRSARYFIFAWTVLATSALIGMLSLVDVFPSNSFTTYCFQVGVFLEAGLFSLALMDKSRYALEQDIFQATKDLRNNMEFIEEQNARLDIARKDAINASNIKSQFLANMSHEIRTPLNAILGFSRELNRLKLPAEQQEHVRIINAAADSLLSIVNDVLDVSKIEAGKLHISNQPYSPNEVLEEMVSVMAKSAHKKGLEFIFEMQPLPEKLVGDAQRIKQILTNLLNNALKFTEHGHVRVSASASTLPHDICELKFVIQDTGIGISQQDRKKLFNAFSQVENDISRPYQGTGLGLVICQQLVRLMGGQISLESTPGQGSCFTVTLRSNLLNGTSCFEPLIHWRNFNTLVFHSCPFARRATASLLKYAGAKVTSCESLEEFIDLKGQYDRVFIENRLLQRLTLDTLEHKLDEFKCNNCIILYSSNRFESAPDLQTHSKVNALRMPLTIEKLLSLDQAQVAENQDALRQALSTLPAARILVVDDIEMNIKLLKTWLSPSPLHITLAYSGKQAVELCEQQAFELILMDVQMPNMDGLQATRLIRQTELNVGTPIIAVTAHALKEEQERLMSSGMDDYLPKPLDMAKLIELIHSWCQEGGHEAVDMSSIDWQLAIERSNHNERAAKELLGVFLAQLPQMRDTISEAAKSLNYDQLQQQIHKLNGACCYTGVPKLRSLCDEIESALKRNETEAAVGRLEALYEEIESILIQASEPQFAPLVDGTA